MKSLIHLLPLVGMFLIITSCGPTQVATSRNPMFERDVLYANSWELAEINGNMITPSGERISYITFTPGSNRITGYTSCNHLGGTISFTGTSGIDFTPVITTKNTCIGNSLDNTLVPVLQDVDTWAIVNDNLLMYRNGKMVTRWSPSRFSVEDLDGNWQLAYVSDNTLPFDVLYPKDKRPTLVFDADGDIVRGTTGFNTISCPVKVNGLGIAFADCTSTNMACEGPGEAIFLDNLKTIDHYTFTDDNTLVLVTADNKVMRFKRM